VPDYYRCRPKKCMAAGAGSSSHFTGGKILPCHAAETITGLEFESVRSNHSIAWIWQELRSLQSLSRHRLDAEPCQSCEFKEIDFGRCRCQAFALTGDAGNTDPACTLSPLHEQIFKTGRVRGGGRQQPFHLSQLRRWYAGDGRRRCRLTPTRQSQRQPLRSVRTADLAAACRSAIATRSTSKPSVAPMAFPRCIGIGGPGSGCQPDHRRLFDPSASTRCCSISVALAGAGPKAAAKTIRCRI